MKNAWSIELCETHNLECYTNPRAHKLSWMRFLDMLLASQ